MLSEKAVEKLELALTGVIRDLGHDPADGYVRRIVARHLRALTVRATSTGAIQQNN